MGGLQVVTFGMSRAGAGTILSFWEKEEGAENEENAQVDEGPAGELEDFKLETKTFYARQRLPRCCNERRKRRTARCPE